MSDQEADVPTAFSGTGDGVLTKAKVGQKHPSVMDMVMEALRESDIQRKGTSVDSIKKSISGRYPTVVLRKSNLKNALAKGMASGTIDRPKKQDDTMAVLVGSYRLGKPAKPSGKVTKAAVAKAGATKRAAKKAVKPKDALATPVRTGKLGKQLVKVRARSASLTPRISKSKKIRSRLSKSHSPLATPKLARASKPIKKTVGKKDAKSGSKLPADVKKSPAATKKLPAGKATKKVMKTPEPKKSKASAKASSVSEPAMDGQNTSPVSKSSVTENGAKKISAKAGKKVDVKADKVATKKRK